MCYKVETVDIKPYKICRTREIYQQIDDRLKSIVRRFEVKDFKDFSVNAVDIFREIYIAGVEDAVSVKIIQITDNQEMH